MHHLSIFSLKIYKSKSRRKVRWQVGAEKEAMSSKYYIKFKIWNVKNTSSLVKSENRRFFNGLSLTVLQYLVSMCVYVD